MIGVVPTSPYHTQFAWAMSLVPKSTGTGDAASTVVLSTSPAVASVVAVFDALRPKNADMIESPIQATIIHIDYTRASPEKGFLVGR